MIGFALYGFDASVHYDRQARKVSPEKEWSPQPSEEEFRAFFPEYREWIHTVNCAIAELVQADHAYVLQDSWANPPYRETWIYKADGTKRCIKKEYGIREN